MEYFGELEELLLKAMSLNEDDIVGLALDNNDTKEYIINLQTLEQLRYEGVNADGESLGEYALYTKNEKRIKGEIFDHITLQDTGAMYRSTEVEMNYDGFTIEMDTIKDGDDLQRRFKNFVGLTDKSISKLVDHAEPKVIDQIEKWFE